MVFSGGLPCYACRRVGEGARQGDSTHRGTGELSLMTPHLVLSISLCWAAEAARLSWLTQEGAPSPSCREVHPPGSWDVGLVRSWRPAAVRYVLHQGLGPCRAWWQGSCCCSVGGSAPTQLLLPHGIHIQWGCKHYSRGNSLALIQLFGCLLGKEAPTCLAKSGSAGKFRWLFSHKLGSISKAGHDRSSIALIWGSGRAILSVSIWGSLCILCCAFCFSFVLLRICGLVMRNFRKFLIEILFISPFPLPISKIGPVFWLIPSASPVLS